MDRERLGACTVEELTATAARLSCVMTATHAALLEVLGELDRRKAFEADACISMTDWVSFKFETDRRTAHQWVETQRKLESLPSIAQSFRAGELTWDKVTAAADLAEAGEGEAEVLERAKRMEATHLRSAARRARRVTREAAKRRHQERFLALRRMRDRGGVSLEGFLPDADGETLIKAIEAVAGAAVPNPDTGAYDAYDKRCADALVEIASDSLAKVQSERGDRAMVVTHVDISELSAEEGVAHLEGETPISLDTARRLACDAAFDLTFVKDGLPVGTGKRFRKPPAWLFRQLRERDVGCRFPGCSRTRLVNAHHIEFWSNGGGTDRKNLVLLCHTHHRAMHEGGWTMRGDPDDDVEFVSPTGRVLASALPSLDEETKRRLLDPAFKGIT